MKKWIGTLLMAVILFGSLQPDSFAAFTMETAAVEWNGTALGTDARILEGNAYLPLDAVGKALGYHVAFSQKDRRISATKGTKKFVVELNTNMITVNGHSYCMGGDFSGLRMEDIMMFEDAAYLSIPFLEENFAVHVDWDKKANKLILKPVKENAVTIKTIKGTQGNNDIKITLQYPQISGLKNKAVQNGINAAMKKYAEAARNEGLNNVKQYRTGSGIESEGAHAFETYFNYRICYNQNNLLSIVFNDYQYAGGAHGGTIQSSHTFNLLTGKEYQLKDLTLNSTVLTVRINQSVKKRMGEMEKEQGKPNPPFRSIKVDQGFFLNNHSIVVYFQEYEYYPYAAGVQEFATEYSSLKGVLKPGFIKP